MSCFKIEIKIVPDIFKRVTNNDAVGKERFKEELLQVLDQKHHWGWETIVGPDMRKTQLIIHFQQEYEVYIRDFPIFLARVLGRMTGDENPLKHELSENIYEEQTGGLTKAFSKGKSHPELFLKMMKGLGYSRTAFQNISLLPTSLAYRSFLDLITLTYDWRIGAVALTLFVEGSIEDRERLKKNYRPANDLQTKLKNHSLYKYHGLKISDMDLVKTHYHVEGNHRRSAWETVLGCIPPSLEQEVVLTMNRCLELWVLFRDGVCVEMGLENPDYKKLLQSSV